MASLIFSSRLSKEPESIFTNFQGHYHTLAPLPSPIACIPPELLGEIFCACVSLSSHSPICLSVVCKTWRQVVRSTPGIWTRLSLSIWSCQEGSDNRAVFTGAIRKAKLWFAMSGVCLVDVDVRIMAPDNRTRNHVSPTSNASPVITEMLSTPLQYSPLAYVLQRHLIRIGSFALKAEEIGQERAFLAAMYFPPPVEEQLSDGLYDAPVLKNITLHIVSTNESWPELSYPSTTSSASPFRVCPRTLSAKLVNFPVPCDWLVLTSLTSLQLSRSIHAVPLSIDHILDLLRGLPALHCLEIACRIREAPRTSTIDHSRLLILSILERLKLTLNNIHGVLTSLRMPALVSLDIVDLGGSSPWTGRALLSMLSCTPSPRIRSLRLEAVLGMEDGIMDRCLKLLPWLQKLQLERCNVHPNIFSSPERLALEAKDRRSPEGNLI